MVRAHLGMMCRGRPPSLGPFDERSESGDKRRIPVIAPKLVGSKTRRFHAATAPQSNWQQIGL